uniref:DUF19 domain-containing protein n=1 Tax=Caenorhabditis tropicalis TaxID=1561998 RepID=A0A1I7V295_9PELO
MHLKLLVLGIISVGLAHGASVASSSQNCTVEEGFEAYKCASQLYEFNDFITDLDMEDKTQVLEFKSFCDSLQSCYRSMLCTNPNNETEKKLTGIKNYCDAVVFVSTEFAACSNKLEVQNSTCYQDWSPFPPAIDSELDPKKREILIKNACMNYFGPENCMKEVIVDLCGEQDWFGFRDHFLSISNLLYTCDIPQWP